MSYNTEKVIRKWYELLEVPAHYKEDFEKAIGSTEIPENTRIENYNLESREGATNFLSFLYMCEDAERRFLERGISREIILATLKDVIAQADRYYDCGKGFYLGELDWLARHMKAQIFKLGRLQFAFGKACCNSEKYKMKQYEPVLEVHIDADGPLLPSECDISFEMAENFFHKHYPEYRYRFYTCHSWLLGSNLERIIENGSNICRFRERFDILGEEPSDDILKYVFHWNTDRENISVTEPFNEFSMKIRKEALDGNEFFIGYGILPRE